MSDQFQSETALVLFSGGQDSATCLAWALRRYARVEMLGFGYGQRHAIELECRDRLIGGMKSLRADWASRLGESHTLEIPTLATISDTALTRDVAIAMGEDGLPNTFVPGRNLMFLTLAAARYLYDRQREGAGEGPFYWTAGLLALQVVLMETFSDTLW